MAIEPNQKQITTGQKVGVAFMFVFALLAVGLGFLQMRTTVYGPFVSQNRSSVSAAEQAQILFDETLRLQRIDTDQDGLNDFEELNFYQTSAYLPDTDSDGISDKKELDDGTDPLCPEGKDCGLGVEGAFTTEVEDNPTLENPVFDGAVDASSAVFGNGSGGGQTSLFDLGAMLQDPTQLRAAILATGQVNPQELATLTDDQLLDLAQQALKSQPSANNTGTTGGSAQTQPTIDVTPDQLEALLEQPAELRQLLISTGKMSQDQLDQIDDATLISVTKQIIADSR